MNPKELTDQELSNLSLDLQADLYGIGEVRRDLKNKVDHFTKRMKEVQKHFDLVQTELMGRKNEVKHLGEGESSKKKSSLSPLVKQLLALNEAEREKLLKELENE